MSKNRDLRSNLDLCQKVGYTIRSRSLYKKFTSFFPVDLFEFTGPLCLAMCWILALGTSLLLFHLVVGYAFILAENWRIPILNKRIKEVKKLRQRLAYSSFACKSSWILIISLDLWELKGSKSMQIAHREYE